MLMPAQRCPHHLLGRREAVEPRCWTRHPHRRGGPALPCPCPSPFSQSQKHQHRPSSWCRTPRPPCRRSRSWSWPAPMRTLPHRAQSVSESNHKIACGPPQRAFDRIRHRGTDRSSRCTDSSGVAPRPTCQRRGGRSWTRPALPRRLHRLDRDGSPDFIYRAELGGITLELIPANNDGCFTTGARVRAALAARRGFSAGDCAVAAAIGQRYLRRCTNIVRRISGGGTGGRTVCTTFPRPFHGNDGPADYNPPFTCREMNNCVTHAYERTARKYVRVGDMYHHRVTVRMPCVREASVL